MLRLDRTFLFFWHNILRMNLIENLIKEIESHNLWDRKIDLNRNEYLKVKGSIDTNLYFILSGSLRMFIIDEYEEHTIRFGYSKNLIAALDSYLSEKPSDLYIQAIKRTELKVISKKRFAALLANSDDLKSAWLLILEELIVQQMEREIDILTSSPIERYRRVLKRSPRLFQEIPNKYIASYLRMSPETLSRIKKY